MKRYHIITFGCQMNHSDSERIAGILQEHGWKPAAQPEKTDLVIINMCSVRQSAVDRIFGKANELSKLKNKNPKILTMLTGCVSKKDRLKFLKKFDYVIDIKDISQLPRLLGQKFNDKPKNYLEIKPKYENKFSANIPIMTGCNNFCAYCVVPYSRGREISRPAEEIICEIKNLVKNGVKEIWLLGQNVNSYKDGKVNFPKLLRMVNGIPGDFWIRFTSSHPKDFSDDLIEAMAECKKAKKYLNLPVQAGDNKILKKMNRPYTIAHYNGLIKKVRNKIPDICISTDIIVGFPGETKTQFENSAKLFEDIKYDMAYIAKYSPRPNTAAEKLKDDVPRTEKSRREKVLNGILKKTALENNKKYIGKKVMALIDRKNAKEKNMWIGKTENYKTIQVKSNKNLIGKFIQAEIIDAYPWGLKGKILCLEEVSPPPGGETSKY